MESVLFPSLLLVAAYPRSGSPQHEWMQSPPMPSGTSTPFSVRLSPELEAVPPGGSVWLNCSHSCPLPVRSSLRTQLRQGKTLHGSGWVSYQLLDVRAWNSKVRCVVTCAGETREATARITAYKRPRSVIMEPPVLVGHKYTLRCYVTHVFPVGFLVVSLRRGGRVIYFESLERFTGSDLANVTLTYVMRAGPNDLWQPITCHARLNLDGLVVRSSSAPVMLTVLGEAPCNLGELVRERGCCHSKRAHRTGVGTTLGGPQTSSFLIFTSAPSFEPSLQSLGFCLHRSHGWDPPGCGGCLRAQVPGRADSVINGC
ncbi:Intercellular adhesion molecule 4 [Cricetulus griseus]|uniref:Intercellular adhesion molecule 4 n=1 Tax=Cricetulus griseus TaxID=10029 RepID=G3H6D3_CRIGR|nr:Intercellular adhesion molecule 4 [Cricetulus griseus]